MPGDRLTLEVRSQRRIRDIWRFTTEAPTPGAHGTRVAFIHPKSTGGVLIELAEHPA